MREMAVVLVVTGLILTLTGLLLYAFARGSWLGRLPGDIAWHGERTSIFFPVTSCLLISLVLTLLLNLIFRRLK